MVGSGAPSCDSKTRRFSPGAGAISTISAYVPGRCTPRSCARRMRTPKSRRSTANGRARGGRRRRGGHRRRRQGIDLEPRGRRQGARSSVGPSPSIEFVMSASRSALSWRPTAIAPKMPSISSRSAIADCRRSSIRSPPRLRTRRSSIRTVTGNVVGERSVSLRRSQSARSPQRASRPRRRPLPAQFLHADRNLRHCRRIRCRRRCLRRTRQFPGTLQSPSGHGTRAQGPRQSLAAARHRRIPAAASGSSKRSFPTSC